MTDDTVTYTIEGPDGDSDDLELPPGLVELLQEEDDSGPVVVGDMALISLVQQVHGAVHHAEGDVDPELESIEEQAREQFEERLGITFEQATGHSH